MKTRKGLVVAALAMMAIGYMVLPIYFGLSDRETDIVAAVLLPLAIGIYTYEDFRCTKPPAQLLKVLSPACLLLFLVAASALLGGVRFAALIPVGALWGGMLYWYIDKYLPASSE